MTGRSFFDSDAVQKALRAPEHKALSKFGAFTMRRARKSIKRAPVQTLKTMSADELNQFKKQVALAKYYGRPKPNRPRRLLSSRPGSPPLSQTGLLRQFILFSYDFAAASVVIGAEKLNRPSDAQRTLEHGGTTTLYGEQIDIEPRPYMQPAFDAELPGAADMFKDSIRA